MALKKYKPTSPGRRFMTSVEFPEKGGKPTEKSLLRQIKKTGGRNNSGRITVWQKGGGHKRRYRVVDFKRNKRDIPAKVA